jgi:AraC-like DNA-binding protein
MQDFYRKTLVALVVLLVADALIACYCFYRSYPSSSLMPRAGDAPRWRLASFSDAPYGGASTIRIDHSTPESLVFDFKYSNALQYPMASAALLMTDADGKPAPADLAKFSTVTFVAKCVPANTLAFTLTAFDKDVTKPGEVLTYPPAMTFFACNEKGSPVSLDLTRLFIPPWWFEAMHTDLSHQSYQLDQVMKFEFGGSQHTPHERDFHVEISEVTLHGRDGRYIVALIVILVISLGAFGIWFLWAHSRALVASLNSRLKKDKSFLAYRQLTLESFGDQEKATILRFIATEYANPGLDLDGVVAGTGASRNKINEVLKTDLGMTFPGYLKKLRLTEAARLLTDKAGATVVEVAYSVGYSNVSYFTKLFKEEYGCTPTVFRTLATRPASSSGPDRVRPSTESLHEVR